MEKKRRRESLIFVGLLCLIVTQTESASPVTIPVGVILDLNSSLGTATLNCTNIALQDFYSTYRNYSTRLQLHFKDSGKDDLLTAASAAWNLINNKDTKVHAILGPQNSDQARYVVEHGDKSAVPVIWFSPSGPSLLPPRTRFFIHSNSTRSHCSQFEAIAAIIEAYNWQSVIPIYEDPEFGNDLIPCLTYALQEMDTRVPYISPISQNSTEDQINQELDKIKGKRTFVFIAHMTEDLWSKVLKQAQNKGLVREGYAWILTQGLSSVLNSTALDIKTKGYLDGALGVRPFVLSNLAKRLSLAETLRSKYDNSLSLYGLWAYDTIRALAMAVENTGLADFNESMGDLRKITGPKLREKILDTNFSGLSGNFNLRHSQLEPSQVVVYNVNGSKEMKIGHWSPEKGLVKNDSEVKWPGNVKEIPPKLKVGVPKAHFTEFVNVSGEGQDVLATGFAVDVFQKVIDALPFHLSYEFVPLDNDRGYDDLLCHITDKNVDVIIGDITIVVSRTNCVDFTMPYLDSSVAMLVKVRSDSNNGWILLKPFDWILWLILGLTFVGATVIVIILERKAKDGDESKFKHFVRNPFLIYMSDVEFLKSGTSKWVVIVVMFVLGIAIQIYTANLTSVLSERTTAKPSPEKDLQEIKRNNRFVGYQRDSWVRELLIKQIGIKEDRLKPLENHMEYEKALSNEDKEKRVDAIFDEIPYLLLFVSNYTSYKMTGPIYKAGGFAFAFPKTSTLVSNFSDAILEVTQNVTSFRDMKNNISFPVTIEKSEYKSDVEMRSLTTDDFGGFFPIVYTVLALFFTISILKVPSIGARLHDKFVSFLSPSGGVILVKK